MKHGRLIDADALMRDINESLREMTSLGIAVDGDWLWAKLNDAIEHAPTIEERKKGKWIEQDDGWDGVYYECSVCKEAFTLIDGTPSDNFYNFCPNCGARMESGA